MNRAHPELPRALQIQRPVIYEQTFFRTALGHLERQAVNSLVGFPYADKAGTEKSFKLTAQIELFNSSNVELKRLVIDCCEQVFSRLCQSRKNRA